MERPDVNSTQIKTPQTIQQKGWHECSTPEWNSAWQIILRTRLGTYIHWIWAPPSFRSHTFVVGSTTVPSRSRSWWLLDETALLWRDHGCRIWSRFVAPCVLGCGRCTSCGFPSQESYLLVRRCKSSIHVVSTRNAPRRRYCSVCSEVKSRRYNGVNEWVPGPSTVATDRPLASSWLA